MNFLLKIPGPLLIFFGACSLSFGGLIVKSFEGATLWQILFWRQFFFILVVSFFLILTYKKGVFNALYKSGVPGIFGGLILGGDCSVGTQKVISITAIGKEGELKLRRNSCKPGEIILTTGLHGLSKLGLMIKNKHKFNNDIVLTKKLIDQSIKQFCRPELRPNFIKTLMKEETGSL